jgi:Rrf2 family cysteine metabolism transcriptional repressor
MMLVSQKSHYALRAVFELAKHQGQGPINMSFIAEKQGIPPRFLGAILYQLKLDGIVVSRRGADGGYLLAREAGDITVFDVFSSVQGAVELGGGGDSESLDFDVFKQFWQNMEKSITTSLQATSIQEFVRLELERMESYQANYSI